MKASATDVKNCFGKYLKLCRQEDIYITKNEKIIAKLSSFDKAAEGYLVALEGSNAYNYSGSKVSYEEFLQITEKNEERFEYLNGEVYMSASPGMTHQIIHSNLYAKLITWFNGKECRVFSAPFDVTLSNKEANSKNVVQPDILVVCDHHTARNENDRYMGVPSLIIEILSPQSRSIDLVKKLNVYLEGGVPEYWIVDPAQQQIIQYYFIEKQPMEVLLNSFSTTLKSFHFPGLEIDVRDVFLDTP